ncbi:MAG: DUF6899 family protein [Nitrosopumilaceae archaeon]
MPYIKQEKRYALDPTIDRLTSQIRILDSKEGNLNYTITRLLTDVYDEVSYTNINTMIGILGCVQQELYRRVAVPYENQKAFENGDVFSDTPVKIEPPHTISEAIDPGGMV